MTPLRKPAPALQPASGYPVVIGPRTAFATYGSVPRAWAEVYAAALAGRDGLRVDTMGSAEASALPNEFILRELPEPCAPQFKGLAALLQQRW